MEVDVFFPIHRLNSFPGVMDWKASKTITVLAMIEEMAIVKIMQKAVFLNMQVTDVGRPMNTNGQRKEI